MLWPDKQYFLSSRGCWKARIIYQRWGVTEFMRVMGWEVEGSYTLFSWMIEFVAVCALWLLQQGLWPRFFIACVYQKDSLPSVSFTCEFKAKELSSRLVSEIWLIYLSYPFQREEDFPFYASHASHALFLEQSGQSSTEHTEVFEWVSECREFVLLSCKAAQREVRWCILKTQSGISKDS